MSISVSSWPPFIPRQWNQKIGHWDARVLTDRAEVEECRRLLGQPEPSWWAVAREYIERFNAEHPIDEGA